MNQNAKTDDNRRKTLLGVTDDVAAEIRRLLIDPDTGRLKVSAVITGDVLTSINGDATAAQTIALGSTGTDANIVDNGTGTHTIHLPTASALNRGLVSATDWATFNGKQAALGYTPENVANLRTAFQVTPDDTHYPSEKLVKDSLDGKSATSHNHTGVYAPVLGADDNYVTDAEKTVIGNTSGTNSGDSATPAETATTIGALIGGAADAAPNDTDFVATSLTASGILKKITWTNVKAFLKTYFDSLETTLSNKTLTKPIINASVSGVQAYSPAGGATATLDLSLANRHSITMPAGNITVALSSATVGQVFIVELTQDGTGGRSVTWFTTIRWADGIVPVLSGANKRDVLGFIVTGEGTYDGFIVGQNI